MARDDRSCASCCASSPALSHTPTGCFRARSSSRRSVHAASGTMMGPAGRVAGTSPSSPSTCHESGSTRRWRITRSGSTGQLLAAVYTRLERADAEAMHRVHEPLVVVAQLDVRADEVRDHVGHLGG